MENFFTRDSGHISEHRQFMIKITTWNIREIGAIEWVAHFHLLLYSSPSSY